MGCCCRRRSWTSVGRVTTGGEQGLLGLAFDPDYADERRFFVDYTDGSGNTVVVQFQVVRDDPDRADPASERCS